LSHYTPGVSSDGTVYTGNIISQMYKSSTVYTSIEYVEAKKKHPSERMNW